LPPLRRLPTILRLPFHPLTEVVHVLKVGLTGNIASGKSTVADAWRAMGVTVIDADLLARAAVARGTPGLARIVATWGTQVLGDDGTLDRAALREIVFRDPDARARLEAIVHPEVARLRDAEYRNALARGEPLVAADVPLLFEVGLQGEFDVVVLVDAPEALRMERLLRDRGIDPVTAERMIRAQMPAEQKRPEAHLVIQNAGSREDLAMRAREVMQQLLTRAAAPAGE
jgi:dephospho-CoA kinase